VVLGKTLLFIEPLSLEEIRTGYNFGCTVISFHMKDAGNSFPHIDKNVCAYCVGPRHVLASAFTALKTE
jgi:hypothetical protein